MTILKLDHRELLIDTAELLSSLKLHDDAAELYALIRSESTVVTTSETIAEQSLLGLQNLKVIIDHELKERGA